LRFLMKKKKKYENYGIFDNSTKKIGRQSIKKRHSFMN